MEGEVIKGWHTVALYIKGNGVIDVHRSGEYGARVKRTDSGFAKGSLNIVSGIHLPAFMPFCKVTKIVDD